ncbi:MAG TPA: hypothetical protein VIK78_04195 [Ruminiclostridium sp.]
MQKRIIMVAFLCLVLVGCNNEVQSDIKTHVSDTTMQASSPDKPAAADSELTAVNKSDLYGIAYNGNNLYVAVGSKGKILTSTDGVGWTNSQSGTNKTLQSVTWGREQFVAVGDEGIILTSKDGINWIPVNSVINASFLKVKWTGSMYIAVGNGRILTSSDGEVWTEKKVPVLRINNVSDDKIPYNISDVLWDGMQYIATGGGNFILTSTNLDNWVVRVPDSRGTGMFCNLAWTGKRYVAVGDHLAMITSLGGHSWTNEGVRINKIESVDDSYTLCLNSVIWGQDKFIVVGQRGLILASTNGLNWEVIPNDSSPSLNQILGDGKKYIAVGASETIITSVDGAKWASAL